MAALAPHCAAVVVIDVFRFTTCVDVACARGAVLYPYRWYDGSEADFAATRDAQVAVKRATAAGEWSLSPHGLSMVPPDTRLVLPSPNGSALCFDALEAGAARVFAGCLRNATAMAGVLRELDGPIGVIAAGERWHGPMGSLRPAIEDLLGAGAILAAVGPDADLSPEAQTARAAFDAVADDLVEFLASSGGGKELLARGWADDLPFCVDLDASTTVPELVGDHFVDRSG